MIQIIYHPVVISNSKQLLIIISRKEKLHTHPLTKMVHDKARQRVLVMDSIGTLYIYSTEVSNTFKHFDSITIYVGSYCSSGDGGVS